MTPRPASEAKSKEKAAKAVEKAAAKAAAKEAKMAQKLQKEKEKELQREKLMEQKEQQKLQLVIEDDDADSICLSVDVEQTDEENESEGCTTVSSSCCSESPSPSLDRQQQQQQEQAERENKWNLTLISQLQNSNEIWQQKQAKRLKSGVNNRRVKTPQRSFSPCSDSSSISSGMMSPLDALLLAADSSFTTLKNATKSSKDRLRGKNQVPCSPSILRRRQNKGKQTTPQNKGAEGTLLLHSPRIDSSGDERGTGDKLQQLAMLTAAPLPGFTSLRGEHFCMSPHDVRRSESLLLLSPCRFQESSRLGDESPTKRRKVVGTSLFTTGPPDLGGNSRNRKQQQLQQHQQQLDEEHVVGSASTGGGIRSAMSAEEDLIALSLLRMKTAHALADDL